MRIKGADLKDEFLFQILAASVKFSITKLSDAQRAHLWCKEVVRELENYQHVSPEANVSRFSFICYSSETGMLYFNTTQFSAF